MSNDASAAALSHMTTTPSAPSGSHIEADASNHLDDHNDITSLAEVCANLHRRVTNFLNADPTSEVLRSTQAQTRIAMDVIAQALQDYDLERGEISISYNGGKDCLVLLILYLAVLHIHYTSSAAGPGTDKSKGRRFPTSIPSIYAKPPDPFPQVTEFVEKSSREYHLDLTHISTTHKIHLPKNSSTNGVLSSNPQNSDKSREDEVKPVSFRDAFAIYLSSHPVVRAIFVGTRRTDPHGAKLTHFDMTDGDWPRFMRVHPVIDWRLSWIWCFLRAPQLASDTNRTVAEAAGNGAVLEYCSMYDEGYTSLGGIGDTVRNPKLRRLRIVKGEDGLEREVEEWMPAFELAVDGEERAGRE